MLFTLATAVAFGAADALSSCHSAIGASCAMQHADDPRACMDCVRRDEPTFLAAKCTAQLARSACRGDAHPNVFGCADVTADGCGTCYDHAVLFAKVCVWCLEDAECHDVGSLQDPCTNSNCISAAVKTRCTDHNRTDCPSMPFLRGGSALKFE